MRRIYREIIGPDVRCSNVALESFGICVGKPLMNVSMIERELEKMYDVDKYTQTFQMSYETGKSKPVALFSNDSNKKINVSRLDHFVEYLKATNSYGHYVIHVRGHAMAYHFLENTNTIWAIDAEERFVNRKHIMTLLEVRGPYLKDTFVNYLQTALTTGRKAKIERI